MRRPNPHRTATWLGASALITAMVIAAGTRPYVMGTRGVVVSGHHQASDAGLDMLKAGGNAVDAGVATVLAARFRS